MNGFKLSTKKKEKKKWLVVYSSADDQLNQTFCAEETKNVEDKLI